MVAEKRLPHLIVICVIILTMLPVFLSALGVSFGCAHPSEILVSPAMESEDQAAVFFEKMSGPFWHTILEWTAFGVALFCSLLSLIHYRLKRDVTTPIIGIALFCSGMLDGFSAMAANRIIFNVPNPDAFFPFTWAVSRTFNVIILMAGTLPFLFGRRSLFSNKKITSEFVFFLLTVILFMLMAYATIHIFAVIIKPPQSIYLSDKTIFVRPFDAIPLVLMLIASGIVFPRFSQMEPGVFSHSLIISLIPAIAGQTLLLTGSKQLYDSNFNIAHFLKILAYSVPLCGLLIDYVRAYRTELILKTTQSKLDAARQIQQKLLPTKAPHIQGFDIAGSSFASEAVGGDYFDYIPFPNGQLGLVVADVSGHDIGASLFMTQVRAYLRALATTACSPLEIVTRLNELLCDDTGDLRFVTFFMIIIDTDQSNFEFISAGHQGFVINSKGTSTEMVSNNPPLGINNQVISTSTSPLIEHGDLVVIPTDGIMEAVSKDKELFGTDRMLKLIHQHRDLSAEKIIEQLHIELSSFTGKDSQTDDVTIVIMKRYSEKKELKTPGPMTSQRPPQSQGKGHSNKKRGKHRR